MKYIAVVKRRFRKPKTVIVLGEDEQYAYQNLHNKYPKYRVLSCTLTFN